MTGSFRLTNGVIGKKAMTGDKWNSIGCGKYNFPYT